MIVTGAGSGIGRAAALAFAAAGADVLGVGRRAEPLAEVAARQPRVVPFVADVRVGEAPTAIVAAAVNRWGKVDVLVNNAGVFAAMSLAETDARRVRDVFDTNVVAPSLLAAAALAELRANAGTIVNVSSMLGHRPAPGAAHYAASKAALEQLTRTWALELAPDRVRVNAVAPGPTDSDALAAAGLSAEAIAKVENDEAERVPLGRRGRADEVAAWIIGFADPAAAWLTGQVLTVDGGLELT